MQDLCKTYLEQPWAVARREREVGDEVMALTMMTSNERWGIDGGDADGDDDEVNGAGDKYGGDEVDKKLLWIRSILL